MFGAAYRKCACQELLWVWNSSLIANQELSLPPFHRCWQKTWDSWSETKDFVTHRNNSWSISNFLGWLPKLQLEEDKLRSAYTATASSEKYPELKQPNLLWWTVSLVFAQRKALSIVHDGQQTWTLLWNEPLPLSFKGFLYQHPRKDSLDRPSVPLHYKTCRNVREPWTTAFSKYPPLVLYIILDAGGFSHKNPSPSASLTDLKEARADLFTVSHAKHVEGHCQQTIRLQDERQPMLLISGVTPQGPGHSQLDKSH